MTSTNGIQGASSNLTNTIDGLVNLYANGNEITGLYINSQAPTNNVNSIITLAPSGVFQVNYNSAPALTVTGNQVIADNIVSQFLLCNLIRTYEIKCYGDNTTLVMTIGNTAGLFIQDIDENQLQYIGYYAYPSYGNVRVQTTYVPIIISAPMSGSINANSVVPPNYEQIRVYNTNVADIFTSICCDGASTNWITSLTNASPVSDPPAYDNSNFYTDPFSMHITPLNQVCLINETGNQHVYIGTSGLANYTANTLTHFRGGISPDFISVDADVTLQFKNNNLASPVLTQLSTSNYSGVSQSNWFYYNGVNLETKWNVSSPPYSNIRMMNGNQTATTTVNNSFFDIQVSGQFTYFFFSPTVSNYETDPSTLAVLRFDNNNNTIFYGNVNIAGNLLVSGALTFSSLALSGTLSVAGLTTTNGISNTGAVSTTTLAVSSTSAFTGIITSVNIINTSGLTTNTLDVNNASQLHSTTVTGTLQNNGSTNITGNLVVGGTITASNIVNSVTASGAGITATPTTGAVVIANTGVTSLIAGQDITVSSATGAVTVAAIRNGPVQSSSIVIAASITPTFTTITANQIGNLFICSNSAGQHVVNLYVPTASQLAVFFGTNAVFEFYIGNTQVTIFDPLFPNIAIAVNTSAVDTNSAWATNYTTFGAPPQNLTTKNYALLNQTFPSGSALLYNALYKVTVMLQGGVAYWYFDFKGIP